MLIGSAIMGKSSAATPLLPRGQRVAVVATERDVCVLLAPVSHHNMGERKLGRAFGGGGFARTMDLQRSRRRRALRGGPQATRVGQSTSSTDEVTKFLLASLSFHTVLAGVSINSWLLLSTFVPEF
jgi:hypothetical protein